MGDADHASGSLEMRGEGAQAKAAPVSTSGEMSDLERANTGYNDSRRSVSHRHASSKSTAQRKNSQSFLRQAATETISASIDAASRALSGIINFGDIKGNEAREREKGTVDVLHMLRHASMIVQMENEDFIEAHAELMDGSDEEGQYKYPDHEVEKDKVVDAPAEARFLPGKDAYAGLWPKFASRFWLDAVLLIILGAFLGLACIGYQYAITSGPRAYLTVDNPGYPLTNVGWGEGQLWWYVAFGYDEYLLGCV